MKTYLALTASVDAFRQMAAAFPNGRNADGSPGMFQVTVGTGGEEPAVLAYLSHGSVGNDAIESLLPYTSYQTDPPTEFPGDVAAFVAEVNARVPGSTLTVEQVEAMLPALEITDEWWEQALARKGWSILPR